MKLEKKYELQKKELERVTKENEELKERLAIYESADRRKLEMLLEINDLRQEWTEHVDEMKKKMFEVNVLLRQAKLLNKQKK